MLILLVDSNETTRNERAAALQHQGWKVVDADDPATALIWVADAAEIDLLITEAIFPSGKMGFELREAVATKFPIAQVLFTTRYDLAGFEANIGDAPVLKDKPFTPDRLVARVMDLTQPAGATPTVEAPALLPPGSVLGNNEIIERLYTEMDSETYRAVQRAVSRQVALVLLKPELLAREDAVRAFKERERIKASVSHHRIAPLYEAGTENGWLFYTREIPPGRSLEEIRAAGEKLTERALAESLHGIAEAMHHAAAERGLHHRALSTRDIYIDSESQASVVNVFRPPADKPRDQHADVRALLGLFKPVIGAGKARGLLQSIAAEDLDWAGLLEHINTVRDEMRERSVIRKAEGVHDDDGAGGKRARSTALLWLAGAVVLMLAAMLGGFAGKGYEEPAPVSRPAEMVWIPKGEFVYQNGERKQLEGFAISKNEVTIAQYAAFLQALKQSPDAKQYDHYEQPPEKKSHVPEGWDAYYAAAASGASFNGQPLSTSCPVTRVDWWDVVAYCKWKGERLPTEEEWERAARGEIGNLFPWGSEAKPGAANLGDDYDRTGVKGGAIDGYNLWSPVGNLDDVSNLGVADLAGNVQEWTATWDTHPDYPDLRVPVMRGGHFGMKSSTQLLTSRYFAESPDEPAFTRGFRTASDQKP